MAKVINPIHGWIILDKPSGITSAHAVAKVKRLLKPSKIGHAGTLDPLASGVLPLALGEATKTVAYMMDAAKSYAFTVKWGEQRDTDDSEGKVINTSPSRPTESEIRNILSQFIGELLQTPPQYSAISVEGKRAYEAARSGVELTLSARKIRVDTLELTNYTQDTASFICHCGKGTYIRSLARDMGHILGCLGHVTMLRRLKVGKFHENHAISLEILEEMVHKGGGFLHPVESALDDILALDIDSNHAMLLRHGQSFTVPRLTSGNPVLARCEGKPVALCSVTDGVIKPLRVFNLP